MKVFILAGEASGDLHGSNLVLALKALNKDIECCGWGGELMEQAGTKIVKHYRDLAFMGFIEVAMNIRTIRKNFKKCRQDILDFKPDVVVMIDYPGFNLRMAPFVKAQNISLVYYISPQIWAWKHSRIHKIKRLVDEMLVILPFEKDYYKRFGMEVDFVGHPLIDAIKADGLKSGNNTASTASRNNLIALLPGSRKQEISKILPIMLESFDGLEDYQLVIAGAPSIQDSFYKDILGSRRIPIGRDGTYSILKKATAALVTSGTATLESALLKVPEVVCYKGNYLSYLIAKRLVKVKFISLVNLIMDKEIVKELIQKDCNRELINKELKKVIIGKDRNKMLADFEELSNILGGAGASKRAAKVVLKTLNISTHDSQQPN